MGKYVLKRIGYMVGVTIILSFLMFLLYNLTPNNRAYTDAKAEMEQRKQAMMGLSQAERDEFFNTLYKEYQIRYGTDTDNMLIRYLRWVGVWPTFEGDFNGKHYEGKLNGLLQGEFGYSYEYKDDVIDVVVEPMKNTIFINIFSVILALGITIPLGIVCAVKKGGKLDQSIQVFSIFGYSLPTFIVIIIFIWIFCSLLGWFPPSGMKTPGSDYTGWKWFTDTMYYLTLPLITMTFCSLASMIRYVRAAMIDALSMDYIRTARAKGVKEKAVIYSHAWRNALIPIVTMVVGWFLGIFAGSLMFEDMFALNGMGRLMIQSLRTSDFDLVLFVQLFYVVISLLGNLIIDLVYGLVDPRVRVDK